MCAAVTLNQKSDFDRAWSLECFGYQEIYRYDTS